MGQNRKVHRLWPLSSGPQGPAPRPPPPGSPPCLHSSLSPRRTSTASSEQLTWHAVVAMNVNGSAGARHSLGVSVLAHRDALAHSFTHSLEALTGENRSPEPFPGWRIVGETNRERLLKWGPGAQ